MDVIKTLLTNLAVLVTCAYLFNLGYKYVLTHVSHRVKQAAAVAIFIVAGWLTMVFGARLHETALFDLRVLPIVFGTLVFRDPRLLIVIGTGIGLFRLTLNGVNAAAVVGFSNAVVLGLIAAALVVWFGRGVWPYAVRATVATVVLNTAQIALIAAFGIVPWREYLFEIAVITYPLGIVLCGFFIVIIRDFYKEQRRADELRTMNLLLRRQTRELRQAKRELEEKARQLLLASRYKSEFVANMSHELKTPLNSIILLSQLILENEDSPSRDQNEDIRYAELIHASGNDLLQLINDILDLSKVEAGKMDIVRETVAVEDAVNLLYHQFMPMAEQKNVAFVVEVGEDVPKLIESDGLRMNQILRNLLANAFKFTEQGMVRLTVSLEIAEAQPYPKRSRSAPLRARRSSATAVETEEEAGGSRQEDEGGQLERKRWIVFAVHDTGIGIEADKQRMIFEAFQQGDGAINRKYGGTGLGLSISDQLTRLLGGDLSLRSEKGVGSVFTLRLPAASEGDGAGVAQT
jgi:signal transduction histidine kinase